MHALRYNRTNGNLCLDHYWKFFPSVHEIGQYFTNFGRQFPITTLTPVTISIVLDESRIDAGSLVQAARNKKALRRIQEKITRARSTLDWSQSNNISCWVIIFNFLIRFSNSFPTAKKLGATGWV